MLGVRDGDEAVKLVLFLDLVVQNSLDNWSRISDSSGFNNDPVERFDLLVELLESAHRPNRHGLCSKTSMTFSLTFSDKIVSSILVLQTSSCESRFKSVWSCPNQHAKLLLAFTSHYLLIHRAASGSKQI